MLPVVELHHLPGLRGVQQGPQVLQAQRPARLRLHEGPERRRQLVELVQGHRVEEPLLVGQQRLVFGHVVARVAPGFDGEAEGFGNQRQVALEGALGVAAVQVAGRAVLQHVAPNGGERHGLPRPLQVAKHLALADVGGVGGHEWKRGGKKTPLAASKLSGVIIE